MLGYTIYRNGAQIDTVNGVFNAYTDISAQSSTAYTDRVDAFDPAGNHSDQSDTVSVKTPSEATHTFHPVADTYVKADAPTNTYGNSIYLRVDASPQTRSYLRFGVQGINSAIQSVTLRVHTNSGSSVGYQAYSVTDTSWTEADTNYDNAPAIGNVVGGPTGAFTDDE